MLVEQKWFYLTHSWRDKGFYTFPKSISPKGNVITRLEFELTWHWFLIIIVKIYQFYIQ